MAYYEIPFPEPRAPLPRTKAELVARYRVHRMTFWRWLLPHRTAMVAVGLAGKQKTVTPAQVRAVDELLGEPED